MKATEDIINVLCNLKLSKAVRLISKYFEVLKNIYI